MNNFGILGIPFGACARWSGCSQAPAALRARGLIKRLEQISSTITIKDFGDTQVIPFREDSTDPRLKNKELLLKAAPEIASKLGQIFSEQHTPVIIGGDHSISIATIASAAKCIPAGSSLGILWIDAHSDLCTPTTTHSGNIHGMSIATLLGHGDPDLTSLIHPAPILTAQQIVYIGLREVEASERNVIREHNIKAYSMREIDQFGIGYVMQAALDYLKQTCSYLWVSFDLDSCDPEVTPGVGTPVRGGLTYREAHLIMELVAELDQLWGLEVVEYNPNRDSHGSTANMALGLLESALGKTIL